jgi:hypothetical protein
VGGEVTRRQCGPWPVGEGDEGETRL